MPYSQVRRLVAPLSLLSLLLLLLISGNHFAGAQDQPAGTTAASAVMPRQYVPVVMNRHYSQPPLPPPIAHTTTPPLDVQSLINSIPEPWQLGLNKIGFHTGPNGNETGIGDWMRALDSAGIPFFLKSVDHAGTIYEAQEIMKASGVPHTLVFRTTKWGNLGDNYDYDVPNYDLSPYEAAVIHWQAHKAKFPPELDPQLVWIETINEVDRGRSEWLAEFALETGQMALRDGYRWAAFGWSSGEPEKANWESPKMLEFLRFAAQHPDDIAIALHEYSYDVKNIGAVYPYMIGRFQALFDVCDSYGIPRPTVLITEWGWTHAKVPGPTEALSDISWASYLYATYPNVKGAAIWYLGGGFENIRNLTQPLIAPVTQFTLSNYYWVASGQGAIDASLFPPPPPRADLPEFPESSDPDSTTSPKLPPELRQETNPEYHPEDRRLH
ncbi:MAG: hypothetical protein PVH65_02585 [Chloroflexota bacterium]|jgi:hypothetical protein